MSKRAAERQKEYEQRLRDDGYRRIQHLPQLYERISAMVDSRMENAMRLADKCWGKAMAVSPDFVRAYLEVADAYLSDKVFIRGSELRRACSSAGVQLPDGLHHNTWVSGVRALSLTAAKKPAVSSVAHLRTIRVTTCGLVTATLWQISGRSGS